MQCKRPVLRRIKGTREYVITPCGLCECCRKNHAHQWGVRIMNESAMHDDNVFITLTYDNDHLPLNKFGMSTLVKKDVQDFQKRLREDVYPDKIRFYSVGEYGDHTRRAHYHVICFGLSMNDNRVFKNHRQRDDGYVVVCSAWPFGEVHVAKVEQGSANYVAQYAMKKIKGKGAQEKYRELDIMPEFAIMSNRPGIGYDFMVKFADDIKTHQFMIVDGNKLAVPRYYVDKLDIKNTEKYKDTIDKKYKANMEVFSKSFGSPEELQKFVKKILEEAEQYRKNVDHKYKNEKKGIL